MTSERSRGGKRPTRTAVDWPGDGWQRGWFSILAHHSTLCLAATEFWFPSWLSVIKLGVSTRIIANGEIEARKSGIGICFRPPRAERRRAAEKLRLAPVCHALCCTKPCQTPMVRPSRAGCVSVRERSARFPELSFKSSPVPPRVKACTRGRVGGERPRFPEFSSRKWWSGSDCLLASLA